MLTKTENDILALRVGKAKENNPEYLLRYTQGL
jgi:hypothetical protein